MYILVKVHSDNLDSIKASIRLLVAETVPTYILIVGLDEGCDDKEKWSDVLDIVRFFDDLAQNGPSSVQVWSNGQDRPCIWAKLKIF